MIHLFTGGVCTRVYSYKRHWEEARRFHLNDIQR